MYKTYVQSAVKKDRLVRWPSNCFPLKFYAAPFRWYKNPADKQDYMTMVKDALDIWSYVTKGVVKFEYVDKLMDSQVNLDWRRVDRKALGYCEYSYDKMGRLYSAEVQIGLSDGIIHQKYMKKEEVLHTILHEIGHALGLGHSPNPDDIMYTPHRYGVVGLSQGDVETIKWLYKFENGITLEEACQIFKINASSFDELIFKLEFSNNPKNKIAQRASSKVEHKNLLDEHQKIEELKKYVMGLQNIQISSDVNLYLKKNIRHRFPFDNRKG